MASKNTTLRVGGWTAASRKKLSGIRSPHKADPKQFTLDRDEAWAALVDSGVASGEAPTALDSEAELARWQAVKSSLPYPQKHHACPTKALIGFWVGSWGLTAPLDLFFPNHDNALNNLLDTSSVGGKNAYIFAALRRYLFAAPIEDYLAAKASFEARYNQIAASKEWDDRKLRDNLTFLFSRDQDWVETLLEKHFEAGKSGYIISRHPVLAAIADPQLALRYAKTWTMVHYEMGPWAHDVVESLDVAAIPVLEDIIGKCRSARDRKPMQAALKVAQKLPVGGPAAAEPKATKGPKLDLPASLSEPFAESSKAKKVKRPKKVPLPAEVLTLTLSDDRRAAVQAKLDGVNWKDQAAVQTQVDTYTDQIQQKKHSTQTYWYLWRRLFELKTPALRQWLEDLDPKLLAKTLRDRNGPSFTDVFQFIAFPLADEAPALISRVARGLRPEHLMQFAEWAHSPSIIGRISEIASGKKGAPEAQAWIQARGELAIDALVPAAVNASGKTLAAHIAALSGLAESHNGALKKAIGVLPAPASAYLSGQLGSSDAIARPKSIPTVWQSPGLPRPVHAKSGAELPVAVMQEVGAMMLVAPSSAPMPGMLALKKIATAKSLEALGEHLYSNWKKSGFVAADRWALDYYGFLAGNRITATLTTELTNWSAAGQHRRAFWAVDVLAGLATDDSARALWNIQRENRFDGLTGRAGAGLATIAAARSMTADELHDEMVPDLGLKLGQKLVFDYGPRQFEGQITPELRVRLREVGESWRDGLPGARKSDDGAKVGVAKGQLSHLKRLLLKVRKHQPGRIERAMVDQRRWSKARFEKVLLQHPLMAFLAQGVIWGQYGEGGAMLGCFRVDEGLELVDASDEPTSIEANAAVGAVHPAELDGDRVRAWSAILADYEILQPFAQLDRQIVTAADADSELMALEGSKVKPSRILGLRRRGWTKGSVEDAGLLHSMTRISKGGEGQLVAVSIRFDPGLPVGNYQDSEEQTVVAFDGDHEKLNAIAISETVSDMRWMLEE